jgi:hypothetical protein
MKRGLRKYGMVHGNHKDCDFKLRWVTIGYQFSRHASLASYAHINCYLVESNFHLMQLVRGELSCGFK